MIYGGFVRFSLGRGSVGVVRSCTTLYGTVRMSVGGLRGCIDFLDFVDLLDFVDFVDFDTI